MAFGAMAVFMKEACLSSPALLALEDGSIFKGLAIGADGTSVGEVVFNTAMTGYASEPERMSSDKSLASREVNPVITKVRGSAVWILA